MKYSLSAALAISILTVLCIALDAGAMGRKPDPYDRNRDEIQRRREIENQENPPRPPYHSVPLPQPDNYQFPVPTDIPAEDKGGVYGTANPENGSGGSTGKR